jgi:hypothetical protein
VLGDLFTAGQIDSLGVVDEDPQRLAAGALHGDDVEFRIEVGKLLLDVLLEVGHACFGP